MQKEPILDVVFLDSGLYAAEGFTSGLLIFVRNMLAKFQEYNLRVGIISFVEARSAKFWTDHGPGLKFRKDSGLDIYEYLADSSEMTQPYRVLDTIATLLRRAQPHTIIMNTPAVFLDKLDVAVRRLANQFGKKTIHVLADQLFPTQQTHDISLVKELYRELAQGQVIGVTERIRNEFTAASGIICTPFKNLIKTDDIAVNSSEYNPRYIGMVNTHPLKGIEIFDRVAKKLPQHDFLVVKNWLDVPDYLPSSTNVTVKDFVIKPKDFYKSLKLLMIPSLMQEGPTMVSIEALYNGIPVIAHRIGSIPEVGGDAIKFVTPPTIRGNRCVGTVLYPNCTNSSLDLVSNAFCSAIQETLQTMTNTTVEHFKCVARADIIAGQRMMDLLIDGWVKNIRLGV